MNTMKTRLFRAGRNAALLIAVSAPAFALGPGRLAATAAINGLSSEVSGPLAYGLSLIAIVGTAVSWYRHHHDMGALAQGGMGALFVGGVALGASSLMGFIPGVTGALI
jgi:type IV secretory pathway VirB2 component (pilin)